jgi:hypothetical protein
MEATAPTWLTRGVPLWVGLSYGDAPLAERPHVAVRAVGEGEFEVLLPMRPAWLSEALGPSLDRAWLQHRPSGELLAVDPHLLAALTRATETSGPIEVPESVDRFLARVAGWVEREVDSLDIDCDLAVLSRPRGELVAAGRVKSIAGGARYGQATEG